MDSKIQGPLIKDQTRQRSGRSLNREQSAVTVTAILAAALVGARLMDVGITQFVFPYVLFYHEAHNRQFRLLIAHELNDWNIVPAIHSESATDAALALARLARVLQEDVHSVDFRALPALEVRFVNGLRLQLEGVSITEPWELRETSCDVLDGGLLIVNTGETGNDVWESIPAPP